MKRDELKNKILSDDKFLVEMHKKWFWANSNDKLCLFYNGERYWLEVIPSGSWFTKEPEELIGCVNTPGWNNIDATEYEEYVGIYNEDTEEWEWDPEFLKENPEFCSKKPSWSNIIDANIETGDWSEFLEQLIDNLLEGE